MRDACTIRLGLPKVGGALPAAAKELGAAVLVSANALAYYDRDGYFRRFRAAPDLDGLDCALDSAGFVAWAHYGGYPWTVEQYVELAGSRHWAWWAQMDACCEPEIADTPGLVRLRQAETIRLLSECRREAARRSIPMPVQVLQGWTAADYAWHALQQDLRGVPLVGVGSVCRRRLTGRDGLLDVIEAVDRALPPECRLHLFGVKSQGLSILASHPRVASIDSMAWDYQARAEARGVTSCNMALRAASMRDWHDRQRQAIASNRGMSGLLPFGQTAPVVPTAFNEWAELVASGEIELESAAAHAAREHLETTAEVL